MSINGFIDGFASAVRSLATLGAVAMEEFQSAVPANWDQLSIPAIERLCHLMERTECNLAWVPGPELIAAVLDTPSRTPAATLLDHAPALSDDLAEALAAIEVPGLAPPLRAACQAVEAYRRGELYSAQATASAVITDAVRELSSTWQLGPARRLFTGLDLERATIIDLRRRTVRRLLGKAIESAPCDSPGPYRRSAALHGVSDAQYTAENATSALLLMVGALCEVREERVAPDRANARRWAMGLPWRASDPASRRLDQLPSPH